MRRGWHLSPLRWDDATEPKGRANWSPQPGLRNEMLRPVASLYLVVGLAFPVPMEFSLWGTFAPRAQIVCFRVFFSHPGIGPRRGSSTA